MKVLIIFVLIFSSAYSFCSINSDQAYSIVAKSTNTEFELSIWSGMHSWLADDFNNDNNLDFVALVYKKGAKKNNPTHLLVLEGLNKLDKFDQYKNKHIIELNAGVPADIEEASTSFYLCYEKGKYQFTRDPNDTP
jgi:hypothetical protein